MTLPVGGTSRTKLVPLVTSMDLVTVANPTRVLAPPKRCGCLVRLVVFAPKTPLVVPPTKLAMTALRIWGVVGIWKTLLVILGTLMVLVGRRLQQHVLELALIIFIGSTDPMLFVRTILGDVVLIQTAQNV